MLERLEAIKIIVWGVVGYSFVVCGLSIVVSALIMCFQGWRGKRNVR
jgi:hypothetical protein